MKALVHTEAYRFELRDVPDPRVESDEALIRVKAVGICGSDVHGMSGKTGRRIPPVVMGHEAAGIIEKVGASVKDFKAGDRVTFDSTIFCGTCGYCRAGRINLCSNRRVLGVSCDEYRRDGAMAEYVSVPERILYRLPENVSYVQATFIEPLSIAFHAVRRAKPDLGESAAVFGAGMIGLFVLQSARIAGCGKIFVVDTNPYRLEVARKLGADVLVDPSAGDPVSAIGGGGERVDLAFEAVGIEPTLRGAIASVRKGGKVVLVGNVTRDVAFPLQSVVTRELDLLGSCASVGEYPACIEAIASGKVEIDSLVSAVAPLSEGPQWFSRLEEGKENLMKVVLEP
jgi:L-iditol 2-dehydrogenase